MQQFTILDAIAAQERALARLATAESYEDWKPIAEAFVVQEKIAQAEDGCRGLRGAEPGESSGPALPDGPA